VFKKLHSCFHLFGTVLLLHALLFCSAAYSQEQKTDTLRSRILREVVVTGRQLQIARASLPEQIKTTKEIMALNAANVADVAQYFSGVTVKDYGGIGGMKTISLRGMGAQHTGICYDGLMLSDIQSGEVDLTILY